MYKRKEKKILQQPASSFADYTKLSVDENVGKDFSVLINAPLSKGGHFVFKSEEAWSVDSSQFSQFFTLNSKTLSAAIDCIPFNEYVDIDEKYFTSDQLTSIYNNAEKGRMVYNTMLDDLNETSLRNDKIETNVESKIDQRTESKITANNIPQEDIDNLQKDVDFLLSLKEPVQSNLMPITQPISISHNDDNKLKSKNISTKPFDLEKWLDSVLDD